MRGLIMAALIAVALVAAGCSGGNNQDKQYRQVNHHAQSRSAYIPRNDVEFNNYNRAQELYDSPDTIIWCTTTWGNPSSPIVTTPIAGKLTSSTTTYFNPTDIQENGSTGITAIPAKSVDGMYHPNPPQYRYGFTPGGQYVDLFNMPTFCTTAMTKFQRQKTAVVTQIDSQAAALTSQAEAALHSGDKGAAQKYMDQLGNAEGGG